VKAKHARQEDARIYFTLAQVKFLKSSERSGLLRSVLSLLSEVSCTLERGLQPIYKIYPVILDEKDIRKLKNALYFYKEVGVRLVLHYDRSKEFLTFCDTLLPLTPKQLRRVKPKYAKHQDAKICLTTAQIKFLKSNEGSGLLSSILLYYPPPCWPVRRV